MGVKSNILWFILGFLGIMAFVGYLLPDARPTSKPSSKPTSNPTSKPASEPNPQPKIPVEVTYYQQFVANIFDPQRFQEIETNLLSRTFTIQITKRGLSRMVKLQNEKSVHELNKLVTKLMAEAIDRDISIYDSIYYKITNLIDPKEIPFIRNSICFLLTTFVVSRLFRCAFLKTLIINCIILRIAFAYLECNNQKRVNQIIAFRNLQKSGNPCQNADLQLPWYVELFKDSPEQACIKYLNDQGKIDRDTCLPDEVVGYCITNTMAFFSETIIKSSIETFKNVTVNSSYIQMAIIGVMIICLMVIFGKVFIFTMISSFFKHGFSNIFHHPSHNESRTFQSPPPHSVPSGVQDIEMTRVNVQQAPINFTVNLVGLNKPSEKIEAIDVTKSTTPIKEIENIGEMEKNSEASSFELVEDFASVTDDGTENEQKKTQ